MAQLAIYVDDETAREVKKAARKAGMSRSEWVSNLVQKELRGQISEEFFRILGTWEDDRAAEEILKEIRADSAQRERPPLN